VLPYFGRFIIALPDIRSLAEVPEDRLLKFWEGLGYYSRVRNLQKAARQVCEQYGGALPATYEQLIQLAGIGPYTAGAIASIAFGQAVPAVDGNVLRVTARLMDCAEDVLLPRTRRQMTGWIQSWIPADAPGLFNQALMELGEQACLPNTTPKCENCPLSGVCFGKHAGTQASLPVRSGAKARRVEKRTVFVILTDEDPPRVLLRRRPESGLLAGLWELPNEPGYLTVSQAAGYLRGRGIEPVTVRQLPESRHLFTHIEWQMRGISVCAKQLAANKNEALATLETLQSQYAVPSAFRFYTGLLPVLMG